MQCKDGCQGSCGEELQLHRKKILFGVRCWLSGIEEIPGVIGRSPPRRILPRVFPLRYRVTRRKSKKELAAALFVEQLLNELICFLDHIDHERLHFFVIEARELVPGNFPEWGGYHYIRVIPGLGIGHYTCVQVLESGVAEAPLHKVLCQSLLQNRVRDENPDGVVSFIPIDLEDIPILPSLVSMTTILAINSRAHLSNQQLKLKAAIVGPCADRAIEGERFRPQVSLPNLAAIDGDAHLAARHLHEQGVGAARIQSRHGRPTLRPYVSITVIPALGAGVHAGITFDGNDELGLWLNAPHCIHQIATIVGAQLETELLAYCS